MPLISAAGEGAFLDECLKLAFAMATVSGGESDMYSLRCMGIVRIELGRGM